MRLALAAIVVAVLAALAAGILLRPTGQPGAAPTPAQGTLIKVFADRTLQKPLEEILSMYVQERCQGCTVKWTWGSSGYALSQLAIEGNGDLYVADDEHFPKKGVQDGLLVPDSLATVGYVRLTLIVKNGNPKNITSLMDALQRPGITVAMGNPEHVSAGVLAWRLFQEANLTGLVEQLVREGKVKYAPSASEAAAWVRAGLVDAAITFHIYAHLYPQDLAEVRDQLLDKVRAPVVVALPTNHSPLAPDLHAYVVAHKDVFWKYGVERP